MTKATTVLHDALRPQPIIAASYQDREVVGAPENLAIFGLHACPLPVSVGIEAVTRGGLCQLQNGRVDLQWTADGTCAFQLTQVFHSVRMTIEIYAFSVKATDWHTAPSDRA